MSKTWIVIKYEYLRHVLRKGFLVALLSVPLWIIISIGVGFLAVLLTNDTTPVGYVDNSGFLSNPIYPQASKGLIKNPALIAFATEQEAKTALDAGKLQSYYVLPADYLTTGKVVEYFIKDRNTDRTSIFVTFLQINHLREVPQDVSKRIHLGSNIVVHSTQENRKSSGADILKIILPLLGAVLMITAVFTSSGYLMQAVVEEKENRTMEIVATSLSPSQIMGGKIVALIGVGLTQILVWGGFALIGLMVAQLYLPFLNSARIDWGMIGTILVLVLPTFVMVAALMAALGATVTEAKEGQQVAGLVTLPVMLPFMLLSAILANPNGIISMVLSFFPLTAAMTIMLRIAFGSVPTWQMAVSAVILVACAAGSLWLAGQVFRMGMLRYGKRISLREVFNELTRAGEK